MDAYRGLFRTQFIFYLLAGLTLASPYQTAQSKDLVIQTAAGRLKGVQNAAFNVNEFKGISYATAERFGDPIPAQP